MRQRGLWFDLVLNFMRLAVFTELIMGHFFPFQTDDLIWFLCGKATKLMDMMVKPVGVKGS